MNKKRNSFMLKLAIGLAAIYGLHVLFNSSAGDASKLQYIKQLGIPDSVAVQLTSQEINDIYTWAKEYAIPNRKDLAPADLKSRILVISSKYNIMN